MFEFLTSIAGGGLLGGLFALAQHGVKLWERKKQREHDLAMREQDRLDLEQEHKLAIERLESEGSIARDLAETKARGEALQASYANDRATYGGGWVDSFRGMTRPGLTWLLVLSLIALTYTSITMLDSAASTELVTSLAKMLAQSLVSAAMTALVWWFGGRLLDKGGI